MQVVNKIDSDGCEFKEYQFSSVYECGAHLAEQDQSKAGYARINASKWVYDVGLQQAIDYCQGKDYWQEGIDSMADGHALAAEHLAEVSISSIGHGVCGFMPDVPEYLAGNPENMYTFNSEPKPVPVVSLAIAGFCAGEDAQEMMYRGVAFMSLVNALEMSGTACEVWYIQKVSGARKQFAVCIKQPGELWQPHTVSFAIAHPAFLRQIFHFWCDIYMDDCGQGELDGGYDFVLPYSCPGDFSTMRDALETIENQARNAGLEITLTKDKAAA